MTPRFVLRARNTASPSVEGLLERLRAADGVDVIDSSTRLVLVQGKESAVSAALQGINGWDLSPETLTPLPDPRVRLRTAPRGSGH